MGTTLEQQLQQDGLDFLGSNHLDDVGKRELGRRLKARAKRAAKLEAELVRVREWAEQGERLREAVTDHGFYSSSNWRTLMVWANREGRGILANRCAAIANALEVEEQEAPAESDQGTENTEESAMSEGGEVTMQDDLKRGSEVASEEARQELLSMIRRHLAEVCYNANALADELEYAQSELVAELLGREPNRISGDSAVKQFKLIRSRLGRAQRRIAEMRNRCAAIADALEAQEAETGTETEPPEGEGDSTADLDDVANEIMLSDMERRGVIPPLEVPSEQEADAKQPCPHEQAEWDDSRAVWVYESRSHEIEYASEPSTPCHVCGKPLPPKPVEFLTWEECWERLPASVCIDRHPDGSYWAYGRDDDDWSTYQATGQSVLAALRALVAVMEEAKHGD